MEKRTEQRTTRRRANEKRVVATFTLAADTVRLLNKLLTAYNNDGPYEVSRGRIIDFLVLEAARKKGIELKGAEDR